jgi:diacylglycerol O-acyltransferase / wax synthase
VLTDDKTFNDPHEATDAITNAFSELRRAAGFPENESSADLFAEQALR